MVDLDAVRGVIVAELSKSVEIPVIRSNTTGTLPKYPFISYTIRQLLNDRKGTWGEYDDGKDRIPTTQIWSITILSDNFAECMSYANKAYLFFSRDGLQNLKDAGITVEEVGAMTNRDTLLTVGYEYRYGFDVNIGFMNETESKIDRVGYIEEANIERVEG